MAVVDSSNSLVVRRARVNLWSLWAAEVEGDPGRAIDV